MAETLIDTLLALQSRDADAIRIRGEMDGIRRERSAREEVLKRYETDVASLRDEQIRIKKEIDDAVDVADKDPYPVPEDALKNVYANVDAQIPWWRQEGQSIADLNPKQEWGDYSSSEKE